jgi:hypothetical protein
MEKATSGALAREFLKEKVEHVLRKGQDPQAGKLNNLDLKVMIQWYKKDGYGAMPKNKEGLLLRYCETCGRVMPGSYIPVITITATSTPTDSDSRYRANPKPNLNFSLNNFDVAVLYPIPGAQSLEHAAAYIAVTIFVAAAKLVPALALRGLASQATLDPDWSDSIDHLGTNDASLMEPQVQMDETHVHVGQSSFYVDCSEYESSDEESVFDISGL